MIMPPVRLNLRALCLGLALALAFLFDCAPVAHAARELTVCAHGCDYTTIQAAIDAAEPTDRIHVSSGTYVEHLSLYAKQVTLTGDDAATTMIAGDNAGRVLFLYANSTLTLTNVTIRDGEAAGNQGGGIYNDGILVIRDSRIIDNAAHVAGGGIANFGKMAIDRSVITGNRARMGNGGGIVNGGRLSVTASTISGNHASGRGGGVYHSVGTLTLTGSRVVGNRADFAGGGIANFDHMRTQDATISANSTPGAGGGFLNGGYLVTVDVTLAGNRAGDGNSIYNGGTLVMRATTTIGGSDAANCTNWGRVVALDRHSDAASLCGSSAIGEFGIAAH